jgi:hypothetical protein
MFTTITTTVWDGDPPDDIGDILADAEMQLESARSVSVMVEGKITALRTKSEDGEVSEG